MKDFNIQPDSTYFIDTNIWLYSFIQSQNTEKTEIARAIIKECEIVISTQTLNERKSRLPHIQGITGEAVVVYCKPLITKKMGYHRLS